MKPSILTTLCFLAFAVGMTTSAAALESKSAKESEKVSAGKIRPIFSHPEDFILMNKQYGGGIWRAKPDGSGLTELSDFGWFAEYSRAGDQIVFGEYYLGGIWIMDSDGSNRHRIADAGGSPSFSPDGTQVTFMTGDTSSASRRIWVMNADGSNTRLLTDRQADRPNWSHFGDKIVFQSYGNGIWVINADGTLETQLTTYGKEASWTPDDSQILFSSYYVYSMNPDGTGVTKRSTLPGQGPSMSADGRIVFEHGGNIYVRYPTGAEVGVVKARYAPDWCIGAGNLPYPLGPIFSGIGHVPSTEITGGYASTDPGYFFYVENAPFGGVMNVFGNFDRSRADGAATYEVKMARWPSDTTPPNPSAYTPIRASWGNYKWNIFSSKYVFYTVGPNEDDQYEIPPAWEHWKLEHLLVRWDTRSLEDGKYTVKLLEYDDLGNPLFLPSPDNEMVVVLDNTRPSAKIDTITYGGAEVLACDILTLSESDVLDFEITAQDHPGHLRGYHLRAYWGENQVFSIGSEWYNPATHGPLWSGVSHASYDYSGWPAPCAYNFRLDVSSRVTNGYNRIHHAQYNKHVTLDVQ